MKRPVVLDATCLIGLERIGRLDLLPALFEPVLVPPVVVAEFGRGEPWFRVEVPRDLALVATLRESVDAGESEALALAKERSLRLASDDRRARAAAARLGVRVLGTLGVLLRAKRAALVPQVRPLLDAIIGKGFYVSRSLRAETLRLAGETSL